MLKKRTISSQHSEDNHSQDDDPIKSARATSSSTATRRPASSSEYASTTDWLSHAFLNPDAETGEEVRLFTDNPPFDASVPFDFSNDNDVDNHFEPEPVQIDEINNEAEEAEAASNSADDNADTVENLPLIKLDEYTQEQAIAKCTDLLKTRGLLKPQKRISELISQCGNVIQLAQLLTFFAENNQLDAARRKKLFYAKHKLKSAPKLIENLQKMNLYSFEFLSDLFKHFNHDQMVNFNLAVDCLFRNKLLNTKEELDETLATVKRIPNFGETLRTLDEAKKLTPDVLAWVKSPKNKGICRLLLLLSDPAGKNEVPLLQLIDLKKLIKLKKWHIEDLYKALVKLDEYNQLNLDNFNLVFARNQDIVAYAACLTLLCKNANLVNIKKSLRMLDKCDFLPELAGSLGLLDRCNAFTPPFLATLTSRKVAILLHAVNPHYLFITSETIQQLITNAQQFFSEDQVNALNTLKSLELEPQQERDLILALIQHNLKFIENVIFLLNILKSLRFGSREIAFDIQINRLARRLDSAPFIEAVLRVIFIDSKFLDDEKQLSHCQLNPQVLNTINQLLLFMVNKPELERERMVAGVASLMQTDMDWIVRLVYVRRILEPEQSLHPFALSKQLRGKPNREDAYTQKVLLMMTAMHIFFQGQRQAVREKVNFIDRWMLMEYIFPWLMIDEFPDTNERKELAACFRAPCEPVKDADRTRLWSHRSSIFYRKDKEVNGQAILDILDKNYKTALPPPPPPL